MQDTGEGCREDTMYRFVFSCRSDMLLIIAINMIKLFVTSSAAPYWYNCFIFYILKVLPTWDKNLENAKTSKQKKPKYRHSAQCAGSQ